MTKEEKLTNLREKMEKDISLPLQKSATKLVFGVGNPDSKIIFIGEGPGYWEDVKGEPFVGNAGKFLDSLLYSIELPRREVYVTNVVHHRPPGNRDPLPQELSAYGEYLDEIIDIIDPKLIVTLGRFSMGKFLPNSKISSVHGKSFDIKWRGKELKLVPMFHPAAGLRNPVVKDQLAEDFKKLKELLKDINKIERKQMQLI